MAENQVAAAAGLHSAALAPVELALPWNWAEVIVPVRLSQENSRLILLGRRKGGQRYLGEDLEALTKAASAVAERLETLRRQEMSRLVAQAELRALQSQINPHFLFNAFNTLYGVIPREASGARRMVLNLADIFRYFLQSEKTFVPLAEEMQIVRAYLEIEKVRLGNRLEVDIQVEEAALQHSHPGALGAAAGGKRREARHRPARRCRFRAHPRPTGGRRTARLGGQQRGASRRPTSASGRPEGARRRRHRLAERAAAPGNLLRLSGQSAVPSQRRNHYGRVFDSDGRPGGPPLTAAPSARYTSSNARVIHCAHNASRLSASASSTRE